MTAEQLNSGQNSASNTGTNTFDRNRKKSLYDKIRDAILRKERSKAVFCNIGGLGEFGKVVGGFGGH